MNMRPLSRAIGLAFLAAAAGVSAHRGTVVPGGPAIQAGQGAPAADAPAEAEDSGLAGLVALESSLDDPLLYLDADDAERGQGDCPGPSGCVADLAINALFLPEFGDGLPLRSRAAVATVSNRPHSTIPGEDIRVRVTVSPGHELEGPRCEPVPEEPRTVVCRLASLAVGEETSVLLRARNVDATQADGWLQAQVLASTPDPIPVNNTRAAAFGISTNPSLVRLAGIDAAACPTLSMHLSATTLSGGFHPAPVPGVDQFMLLDDDVAPLSGPALVPSGQVPVSAVYLVDDSASLPASLLSLQLAVVAESAFDWYQRAASNGWPPPALAVTSLSADTPPELVSDFEALEAQLALIEATSAPADALARAAAVAQTLSGRPGRRGVLLMLAGTSVLGNDEVDPVAPVRDSDVPVHPVVLEAALEPLAERVARATRGFRQVVSAGDVQAALGAAVRTIEDATTVAWEVNGNGDPARRLQVSVPNPPFGLGIQTHYSQAGTPCAQTCTVERAISGPAYSQSTPAQVRLSVAASPDATPFTLVEQLPSGWVAVEVGQGGHYDAFQRLIQWVGVSGAAPAEFTYAIAGPQNAPWGMSRGTLKGALMPWMAASSPTCGATGVTQISRHPADLSSNGRVQRGLLPAYTDAWLHGQPWPSGWGLVSASQLTRAAQIAALGGTYQQVGAALPWRAVAHPPGPYIASAVRTAPAVFVPGQPVRVELRVEPMPGSHASAIEEVPPAGWQVLEIDRSGRFDPMTRTIRWGLYHGDQALQVAYTLLPPPDAAGEFGITGRYFVDGEWVAFAGNATLLPGEDLLFADGFEQR
ncbi:MAG: hypothetical protein KF823_10860 [Xanthomonadales bacterium]|nr:hypothetical protein [Xanthomonadales bacterium]